MKHFSEDVAEEKAEELDYKAILTKVNSYITLYQERKLWDIAYPVEKSQILTNSQKKYILQKIDAGDTLCHKLDDGTLFVWNLDFYCRTYKHYLNTVRYIESLSDREKQKKYIKKLYKFLRHDNSVGKVMSGNRQLVILNRMFRVVVKK